VIEVTPRGGAEVNVIFNDNTSRVVKLANENQQSKPKSPPIRFDSSLDYGKKHKALLRTVSETVPHRPSLDLHSRLMPTESLKRRFDQSTSSGLSNDYYQAPSKSKYAAKMEYINQKNKLDAAKTISWYKNKSNDELDDQNSLIEGDDKTDLKSQISESTCTIDIDRDSVINDNNKIDDQDSPSLHGKSLVYDQSPDLVICDYSRGIISDQSTFKLKIKKSKLDQKKINISVSEGVVKMDSVTQNQYYDSYAKVQVLSTSHRCKICNHISHSEAEMCEHITEHSLKQLMTFN